ELVELGIAKLPPPLGVGDIARIPQFEAKGLGNVRIGPFVIGAKEAAREREGGNGHRRQRGRTHPSRPTHPRAAAATPRAASVSPPPPPQRRLLAARRAAQRDRKTAARRRARGSRRRSFRR